MWLNVGDCAERNCTQRNPSEGVFMSSTSFHHSDKLEYLRLCHKITARKNLDIITVDKARFTLEGNASKALFALLCNCSFFDKSSAVMNHGGNICHAFVHCVQNSMRKRKVWSNARKRLHNFLQPLLFDGVPHLQPEATWDDRDLKKKNGLHIRQALTALTNTPWRILGHCVYRVQFNQSAETSLLK